MRVLNFGVGALVGVLGAVPVWALESCDDLWWSRNHLFDRAGYCFGSALGQAMFDNSNCISQIVPKLSPGAAATVAAIREEETLQQCDVDTSRRTLAVDQLGQRRLLVDVGISDGLESGCIGYRGAAIPVFAGAGAQHARIGEIRAGDSIGLSHYSTFEGWAFVSYGTDGFGPASQIGWVNVEFWDQCDQVAG